MGRRFVLMTACAWAAAILAGATTARSAPEKDEEARKRVLRELLALTDAVAEGASVGGGLKVAFEPHFLKGEEGQTYVPFSVAIDEHSRRPAAFVVYVRVAEAGQAPARGDGNPGGTALATADLAPGELPVGGIANRHPRSGRQGEASARLGLVDKDREAAKGPHVFEDAHVVEVDPDDDVHPYRLQRALAVPPGNYEVYIAVSEVGDSVDAARSGVLRQPLAARDFRGSALSLSSVILASEVRPGSGVSGARGQSRRPYAVGTTEIVPVPSRELAPDDEPAVAFQIYGATPGPGRRPDVGLQYLLLRQAADSYLPHARLPAQKLDASTLPATFDPAAGHQLGAVQDIPVSHLPPGEYLLEVTAKDNVTGTSARAAVDFAVRPH